MGLNFGPNLFMGSLNNSGHKFLGSLNENYHKQTLLLNCKQDTQFTLINEKLLAGNVDNFDQNAHRHRHLRILMERSKQGLFVAPRAEPVSACLLPSIRPSSLPTKIPSDPALN